MAYLAVAVGIVIGVVLIMIGAELLGILDLLISIILGGAATAAEK